MKIQHANILLVILILLCAYSCSEKEDKDNSRVIWARTAVSAANHSHFNAVAVGSDGVYAAGYMEGTGSFDFGNSVIVAGNSTGNNIVLVKYDFNGNAQWAKTLLSGPNSSSFYSIAVGSDGIYAVGSVSGSAVYNFGNSVTITVSSAATAVLIVKYSTSGVAQWAKTVPAGPAKSCFKSVSVGTDGIYAAGYIYGNGTFDFGDSVSSTGSYVSGPNVLIVKYNFDGTSLWAKSVVAGPKDSEFKSIAVGSDGVYASGYIAYNGTFDFGNSVTATGSNATISGRLPTNVLIVKYSYGGEPQWAKTTVAGSMDSSFNSLQVREDGVIAGGYIYGGVTFDFGNSVSVQGRYQFDENFLLIKYTTDGIAQWARAGDVLFVDMDFIGMSSIGNEVYAISNAFPAYEGVFIYSYDTGGVDRWMNNPSSGDTDYANASLFGVAAGNDGIYVAGEVSGPFDFGKGITALGGYSGWNVLLVKYKR